MYAFTFSLLLNRQNISPLHVKQFSLRYHELITKYIFKEELKQKMAGSLTIMQRGEN